jgi:hypothetical protein
MSSSLSESVSDRLLFLGSDRGSRILLSSSSECSKGSAGVCSGFIGLGGSIFELV